MGPGTPTALRDAVVGYADRLHRVLPGGHRVTSPLGAWLVLALAAPAATGDTRGHLTEILGMAVDDASRAAGRLLTDQHPVVAAGAAAWVRDAARTGPLGRWEQALPIAVERGDVPDQARADAWAAEHTLGLINRFPVAVTADVLFVLASALATTVSWQTPYDVGPAAGRWAGQVSSTLRSSVGDDAVLATPLGDVAVHTAHADGLSVTSVVAAAGIADTAVLDVAHRIAVNRRAFPRRSSFSLPLGTSELWTVTEQPGIDGRQSTTVELPAWQARSQHPLLADEGTGFPAAVRTLGRLAGGAGPAAAHQVALARYGREGFEAAAVTSLYAGAAAVVERPGPERRVLLHFHHPYAVVATAARPVGAASDASLPWEGLPVFAAWVTEATEPSDVVTAR